MGIISGAINWMGVKSLHGRASQIVEVVAKAYPITKAQNPTDSEQDVLGRIMQALVTFPTIAAAELAKRKYCGSVEGLCYFLAITINPTMQQLLPWRWKEIADHIDDRLRSLGFRPQTVQMRRQNYIAIKLPEEQWDKETRAVQSRVKRSIESSEDLTVPSQDEAREKKILLAAFAGDAVAQTYIAKRYFFGLRTPQNPTEACKWFREAAEQGYAEAQRCLGRIYEIGCGAQMDKVEAAKWYLLAAEQGDVDAQTEVGRMYMTRIGLPQDDYEAEKWLQLAAEQGDAEAQFWLGGLYVNGEHLAQNSGEAAKWYLRSAEQGYPRSQWNLSTLFVQGIGVPQDFAESYKWISLAAKQGLEEAESERAALALQLSAFDVAAGKLKASKFVPRLERQSTDVMDATRNLLIGGGAASRAYETPRRLNIVR